MEKIRQQQSSGERQVQLRSERMRKVINDRPPFLVRWGTVIITVVLGVAALCLWLIMGGLR